MPLTTGNVLQNRYRIVSLLGQGGMGAVYRAWDTRLNIPVALKEMVPQPGLDHTTLAQLRQQFQQEAVVLARLSHPHLVRVTDFFEEGGNAYLVMDFVEGESLADRITQQGPLPEPEALAWAGQLLDALAYCHGQGLLHRDVKPQNVIIRPDGKAVLVDFGLVKLWDPRDPHTRTAMRGMGTPEYAPPEQYETEAGHTDPRSDIYSLGATLYHALTGQAPPTATLRMADPSRFVPVRGLMPHVSPGTEAAIMRAMELVRTQRWQSAREMTQALGGRPPAPARPAVAPRRERTKVMPGAMPAALPKKRGIPGWVWVVGALVLVLGCVVALGLAGVAARQAQIRTEQAQLTATARSQATATAQARATATARSQATGTARASQATATAKAEATATALALASGVASNWPIVLYEDFSANTYNWPVGEYSDERVTGSRTLADGKYTWEATALEGVVWWSIPNMEPLSDLYLSVEVQMIEGSEEIEYGVIFRRVDRDNYYVFRIQGDREYQLRMRYAGEWETLIEWTESTAIGAGQANRLTVIAEGSHFSLYINDQLVDEYDDSRLDSGEAGLLIGLDKAGDKAFFEFDDFEVRAP
jgi:hypothetical protein